ncbi:extracellular solute-binding protein [Anaerocolumna xylanovorans]|uniref:Multiple sugar transport system substrate-binding protein n=1 Tax=Anaerocolumna xylanovorans DSM 12503 TaxID=1121345 RepID=A0A1M7Y5K3_9FIRM|nr:extracellular solute-binding protein [Anaerocolumna xylanovorans]SHO47540.1 multiple sugar transport system substrate-binding protein [Anaerocolumna xylanovorans DSM 12503]
MKQVKKIALLVILSLSLIFTGCGKTDNAAGKNDSKETNAQSSEGTGTAVPADTLETTKAAEETETPKEPVEIEFWHALGGTLGDTLTGIINEYNASQSKYIIKPVVIGSYSEIDQKLQAAFAGKNAPALVAGGSHDTFYKKGLVEAFEDYMPEDYNKDDIVGGFMDAALRDGKMVFAPAYGTSQVLYYNKAVLTEAGYTEDNLTSWQKLEAMKDKTLGISTNKNKIEYVWEPMWGEYNMMDAVSSAGGKVVSDDGKTVLINDSTWVEVLDQFRKWIHEDKSMKIYSGGQGWEYWYKTMDDWVYGKALGYTGSPGDYAIALDAVNKAITEGYKNEFAVAVQPGWNGNEPKPYFSSLMYYIPKSSNLSEDQKKGAADFVNYATNTGNTAKFSMGTGYVAVRKSVLDLPEYQEYLKSNPDADAALKQIDQYAVPEFIDPTGGAILDALKEAVDKIQIENVPAKKALDEAAKKAQKELDKINK